MNKPELSLRQIAEAASERHGGVRGRAFGRMAEERGLKLTYTTFDKILTGTYHSTPKPETLKALAVLAGLDEETVFRAAGLPEPMAPFAEQVPPDADLLTPPQREAVFAVVRQLAQANKALHGAQRAGGDGDAEEPRSPAPTNKPETGELAQEVDTVAAALKVTARSRAVAQGREGKTGVRNEETEDTG